MEPFRATREALCTIPGISTLVADVIIAETGGDMSVFPTAAHLASWAGVCPGSNESAGRVKSTRIMPGNEYLKGALGIAEMAASRGKNIYVSVKYKLIALRRGRVNAIVHIILTATWHMLANGEVYTDPGSGSYLKTEPEQAKPRPFVSSKPSATLSASHRRLHDLASFSDQESAAPVMGQSGVSAEN
ncbi:IS110 family transposase [Pseudarthrobacter sp. NBSH8]|uniref:IS110 family transposase n=1 Tax=Pseudarthrobacter sp. NBSH8 TaxID=2596911 RepID=UPI0021057B08|nr:IS110 family transposase [Pseudarthrobacter sp. NBSH8]